MMKNWLLAVSVAIAFFVTSAVPQDAKHAPTRNNKPSQKAPFVCSNFVWTWFQNGATTFTLSMKNQSGHGVKSVRFRVLFFDRQGNQIDFVEGVTSAIPDGLAHRESVDLNFDTGASTRKLSAYQKVEILDFEQEK